MGQHEIINFIDGREAIRKFDDVNPDLVLMDIQLVGETSGLEVVKELRAKGVKTPIIAVTAYARVGDKERCIEAGCNDYLAKPLPIPRLIEIFQEYEVSSKVVSAPAPVSATVSDQTPLATQSTAEETATLTAAETRIDNAEPITVTQSSDTVASGETAPTKPLLAPESVIEEKAAIIAESTTTDAHEKTAAPDAKSTASPVSSSIHEDATLPEKSVTTDTPTAATPKTEASTTKTNG
jgi:CheY-like chemotaxis protein